MNLKNKIPPVTPATNDDDQNCRFTWNDVLFEINLRLPAKSLTRFKLISKQWLSLISADHFRRLHTLRHPKPPLSLILRSYNSQFFYLNPIINGEKLIMIPYTFPLPNPKILSSCNGLMLLQCDHDSQTDYYVYNPTTRQSRKLSLAEKDKYIHVMTLDLAFDPSKSPHYKIVCLRADKKSPSLERSYQIEVYDSESRAWKLCVEPFTTNTVLDLSAGVHCNNVIYWEIYNSNSALYFDMDKNVTRFLHKPRIPEPLQGGHLIFYSQLQESNGHLYYSYIASEMIEGDKVVVVLWESRGDDHSRWFLKCHDRISQPAPTVGERGLTTPLRLISGSDDGEMYGLVTHDQSGEIKIYSFLDKSYKEIVELTRQIPFYQDCCLKFYSSDVYQFGESLALV